jgi:hypothetical protein
VAFGGRGGIAMMGVVVSMGVRNPVKTWVPPRATMVLVPRPSAAARTRAFSAQTSITRASSRVLC